MNIGCIDDARRMQLISAPGFMQCFLRARSRLGLISQSPRAGDTLSEMSAGGMKSKSVLTPLPQFLSNRPEAGALSQRSHHVCFIGE